MAKITGYGAISALGVGTRALWTAMADGTDGIGAIRVKQDLSYIQIAAEQADRFGDFMEITPEVTMRRMEGEPDLDAQPERAPRAPRPEFRGETRSDNRSEGRKPAPRPKPAAAEGDHQSRVKAARGGWVPDDGAAAEPRETFDGGVDHLDLLAAGEPHEVPPVLLVGVEDQVGDRHHPDPLRHRPAERIPVAVGGDRADVDRREVRRLGTEGLEPGRDKTLQQAIALGLEVRRE